MSEDRQPSDRDDLPLEQLDDHRDRDELRSRYYGLLQELRVILPGVQVLMAFLLTVPFAQGFDDLDWRGRTLFTVSLSSAAASVVCLIAPTVLHRVGDRTARRERLQWAIRLLVVGLACLAVSMLSALWCVLRLVQPGAESLVLAVAFAVLLVGLWIVLPRVLDHDLD